MLSDYDNYKIETKIDRPPSRVEGPITTSFYAVIGGRKFEGDTQTALCRKVDAERRKELATLVGKLKPALPDVTLAQAAAVFRAHGVDGLDKLRELKAEELTGDLRLLAKPLKSWAAKAPTPLAKTDKSEKGKE
jgi:hypothetical protein